MSTLLFGHRGAGKSTLLKLLAKSHQVYDLDDEITKRTGRSPSEWLAESEVKFRAVEIETLQALLNLGESIIALGAGFEGPLPLAARKVWIRRVTDASGRSFLNRPRLNAKVSPFAEYQERFAIREKRFSSWADEELFLPEGELDGLEFFFADKIKIPGTLTVLPENFRAWKSFTARRNPSLWELREDLLSAEQIALALNTLPADKILFSVRNHSVAPPKNIKLDWALELGDAVDCYSVSLHERRGSLSDCFARLEQTRSTVLKLAVEIETYAELLEGHRWWCADPKRRAFLPRSKDGRWRGYRSLFGPQMPLHFIREGAGSSLDQPLLWQGMLQPPLAKSFAAVLGDPIEHSRSPREHRLGIPFVGFRVGESEFFEALSTLKELGLRFVAVTSPLKKLAASVAQDKTSEVEVSGAANTLTLTDKISAHNTDLLALKKWRDEIGPHPSVAIWGGGGLKETLRQVWPEAMQISARAGVHANVKSPDLVLWAVGRSRDFRFPPSTFRPRLILDLNYGDDSPGLEWAVAEGLAYQSGLKMFKLQAEFQREFWKGQ